MKLIYCEHCKDNVALHYYTRKCYCGNIAGKYLKDKITAIVTEDAVVYGIDSGIGFRDSLKYAQYWHSEHPDIRRDFYFVGWIPSLPGEIIRVKTVDDVLNFDDNYKVEDFDKWGTKPVTD